MRPIPVLLHRAKSRERKNVMNFQKISHSQQSNFSSKNVIIILFSNFLCQLSLSSPLMQITEYKNENWRLLPSPPTMKLLPYQYNLITSCVAELPWHGGTKWTWRHKKKISSLSSRFVCNNHLRVESEREGGEEGEGEGKFWYSVSGGGGRAT